MPETYAIVITTINHPTRPVREIASAAGRLQAQFVLIGDDKSPSDFAQPGSVYLDIAAQRDSGFSYARSAPTRHYARKNVGYLVAIRDGADIIIETDDDNIPRDAFWQPRVKEQHATLVEECEWVNVYAYFTEGQIWPRGLPLNLVTRVPPALSGLPKVLVACPIQQGLADENPDVDAIYRLVLPLPMSFEEAPPVALKGAWCPFNSQNTTWWREAFPLLYLPFHCSFRMTDIWRSYVAQRIAYLNGWGILFHSATVFQERNEHDLMKDFEDEIPGYLHNARIRTALDALGLPAGEEAIPAAMRACYAKLVEMGLVKADELALLDAWLSDLASLR